MENNITLTALEKSILKDAINEGFFYDNFRSATDLDKKSGYFICWGFYGKKERGAAASLEKKGILNIGHCDGETYVYASKNITNRELLDLAGIAY